ncbi:MAG: PQQ-dependent sugar dehydrogenase [Actinobacteria bacterium]|nr:PQQ-dependent sugar dehydrogenase [Actinomycetota bacterium]
MTLVPGSSRVVARRRTRRRAALACGLAVVLAAVLVVVLVGSATAVGGASAGDRRAVRVVRIADVPGGTALASRPGDPALYLAQQSGRVLALRPGRAPVEVLDLTDRTRARGEQGLLGLAFAPDGGRLYVHYSDIDSGDTVVEEFTVDGGRPEPGSRRTVLTVPQPQSNHNGGQLAFGPDGHLYLGLGDGGGQDDTGPGHAPGGNAQSLRSLLGKVLRIDPDPAAGAPYSVPADNPFVAGGGRAEVYVLGLRNPWRFSFDDATGDLWIADVGGSRFEEVTRLAPEVAGGANLGWNRFEGPERFRDDEVAGTVRPQLALSHDDGYCSVVGGHVVRTPSLPALRGWYVFSDYCEGRIRAARIGDDGRTRVRDLGVTVPSATSFGTTGDGTLHVVSQTRGVFRLQPR